MEDKCESVQVAELSKLKGSSVERSSTGMSSVRNSSLLSSNFNIKGTVAADDILKPAVTIYTQYEEEKCSKFAANSAKKTE